MVRLLTAREPFIPLSILHSRVTASITCAAFFSVGTIIGMTIYTPLYCQTVLGFSASQSGLALIGFMVGSVFGAQITSRLMVRIKHYLRLPMFGLLIAIGALAVLAIDPAGLSLIRSGGSAVRGRIRARSDVSGEHYRHAEWRVMPHQLGTATGALNFFRTLGGAIIVAVFGAIVLGGGTEGSGVMTLEKLAAQSRRHGAGLSLGLYHRGGLYRHFVVCLLAVEERPLHGPVRLDEASE